MTDRESEASRTNLGIVGAGTVGRGIARIALLAGFKVHLVDASEEVIESALDAILGELSRPGSFGTAPSSDRGALSRRLTGGVDAETLGESALVLESVPEILSVKQQVLERVQRVCGDRSIVATTASTLPVAQVALHARHPERVVGMHFSTPVAMTTLLEIVGGPGVLPEAVSESCEFGRRLGREVIVLGDGAGRYTTRLAWIYINEALHLLAEGETIETIDGTAEALGFPAGPLWLLDKIGAANVRRFSSALVDSLGDRVGPPDGWTSFVRGENPGRGERKGFYLYDKAGARRGVNPEARGSLSRTPSVTKPRLCGVIRERLLLAVLSEALHCLEDGVLHDPGDGDTGAVLGLGYPKGLGGPFRQADHEGIRTVLKTLSKLEVRCGLRFEPPGILRSTALRSDRFFFR